MPAGIRDYARAIVALVNAPTWEAGKRIVEDNKDILLDENVDSFLNVVLYPMHDDPEGHVQLMLYSDLLKRCRTIGIGPAFAELPPDLAKPGLPPDFSTNIDDLQSDFTARLGLDPALLGEKLEIIGQMLDENPEMMSMLLSLAGDIFGDPQRDREEVYADSVHAIEDDMDLFSLLGQTLTQNAEDDADIASIFEQLSGNTITDKLRAWIYTDTWEESHHFLLRHPELLSDEAEHKLTQIVRDVQASDAGNEEETLVLHLELLRHCRAVGCDEAYRKLLRPSSHERLKLIGELVSQPTWEERQRFVAEHPRLLEDETLTALRTFIEENESVDSNTKRMLNECYRLLTWCQEDGIPEAFAKVERLQPENLYNTLREFAMSATWRDCQQFLAEHPELLTDEAENLLESLVEELQQEDNPEGASLLLDHGYLLRRCREMGAVHVFEKTIGFDTLVPRAYRNIVRQMRDAERRYAQTGSRDALDDGLAAWTTILADADFTDAPRRFKFVVLQDAVAKFEYRYRASTGEMHDLAQTVQLRTQIWEQAASEIADRAAFLEELGTNLQELYQHTRSQADLDSAVATYRQALEYTPDNSLQLLRLVHELGQVLRKRFAARSDGMADLNEAIECQYRALEGAALTRKLHIDVLNALSICLSDRYAATGALEDLENAMQCQEQASVLRNQG